jgi:NADPH-dependent curcumin reductase CurA
MIDISSLSNTRVVLKSRPVGMPTDDNFDIQTVPAGDSAW